jgi:hypothetical protein
MKITVSEALDLKKELALKVQQATRDVQQAQTGEITQNGIVTNPITETFESKLAKLCLLMSYSLELNDKIARFNVQHDIDSKVRFKKNCQVIVQQLQAVVQRTQPTQNRQFQVVGTERVEILTVVRPIVDVEYLKRTIRANQKTITKTQAEIMQLNTREIELSFDETAI